MTNATTGANAPAMPTRRNALAAITRTAAQSAALAALPVAAIAAPGSDDDAEIIALSAEIVRLATAADEIRAARVVPFEDRFREILRGEGDPKLALQKAWAYAADTGREAALDQIEEMDACADHAFFRMMANPAKTPAGRAAKVRALLAHVMRDGWRGPANKLDWDKEMARALLAEFAGMTAQELEAI